MYKSISFDIDKYVTKNSNFKYYVTFAPDVTFNNMYECICYMYNYSVVKEDIFSANLFYDLYRHIKYFVHNVPPGKEAQTINAPLEIKLQN